ncbi:hypothetical protein BCR43DRAFT_73029 [Syncephalastrum racemosum]|uniref:Uncharacterized protein n=1 Tax=Syncephalastrum racemosum TaxID=13706 RepID=A0A1X2H246_SYNRA|nr:hypothetical protein BCR43DRAFT_73029 [Syncephalastrum racemosum]
MRERKMARLSSSLANDVARSLSMSDSKQGDVEMATSSPSTPQPAQQTQPFSGRTLRTPAIRRRRKDEANDSRSPIPTLRRLSSPGSNVTMDFDEWLRTQAQRQDVQVADFRDKFIEKRRQLHECLTQIDTPDNTTSGAEHFQTIKENLSRILTIADELSGDHSLSITDLYPEWSCFEAHIKKLAAYVQSIEDMKQLVSQSVPRTGDLLFDIRRLQSLLDAKSNLYSDNLAQNGLSWKAMGLPVDEPLLAATKGWLYNLCISLLGELDTECCKLQSLVTDMHALLYHPEGTKVMECILQGLEFMAGTVAFIGLPSKKLVYGCRALAAIYGHWTYENLEVLLNDMYETNTASTDTKMSTIRTQRVDLKLMQLVGSMTRILAALQTLQEVNAMHCYDPTMTAAERDVLSSDSYMVLENITSMLVEITVRAVSVLETSQIPKQNGRAPNAKPVNIMSNPQTAFLHMGDSLLAFADKMIELAGREYADGHRMQRLHTQLEEMELQL